MGMDHVVATGILGSRQSVGQLGRTDLDGTGPVGWVSGAQPTKWPELVDGGVRCSDPPYRDRSRFLTASIPSLTPTSDASMTTVGSGAGVGRDVGVSR